MGSGPEQQVADRRHGVDQGVTGPLLAGGPLVGDEVGEVGRVLDLRPTVIAAGMVGDDGAAVEQAHPLGVGEQGEMPRCSDSSKPNSATSSGARPRPAA